MRRAALILALAILAAACGRPSQPDVAATATPSAAAAPAQTAAPAMVGPVNDFPPAVSARIEQLRAIASTGSYRDMARLAEQTPGFRSNDAGWRHAEYWRLKLRAGDWPMAQMQRVLSYPAARVRRDGRIFYVWPYMAELSPRMLTRTAARDIEDLLGPGQAAAIAGGAPWPGYVLGVGEDGTWLFFVSGAG